MLRTIPILLLWLTSLPAADLTITAVVHGATQTRIPLAPNTIATIYGTNLSFSTRAITPADITAGQLPTQFEGVRIQMYGIPCGIFYVSPTQINFLVPYDLTGSSAPLQIFRQGAASEVVNVGLAATSPAFFEWNKNQAVAVHLSGQLVSEDFPAAPGETVILYAAGMGRTALGSSKVPTSPASVIYSPLVQLNGAAVPAENILYAGVIPGYAGLYQINLKLPDSVPENPQIRVQNGGQTSPETVVLPLKNR